MKRTKQTDASEVSHMTVDEFVDSCHVPRKEEKEGMVILHHPLITKHIILPGYVLDIFDFSFIRIEIEPDKNEVRIWSNYGPWRKDEEGKKILDADDRPIRDEIPPKYIVRGLISA